MRRTGNKARAAAALALATWCALATATASAERADRDKPVDIESDSLIADEAKKVATFDGKVVLTQGSLIIRADRIVVQQDNDGFQRGVATGNPARFRHKREGLGEYIDGEALRIEYDTRVDHVEFFKGARLRRLHLLRRQNRALYGEGEQRRVGKRPRGARARDHHAEEAGSPDHGFSRNRAAGLVPVLSERGANPMSQLQVHGLKKRYSSRVVVKDVSLEVSSGEVVGLLGPNGAGKTTCFYMIVGLVAVDDGAIHLDGREISHFAMHRRARMGLSYLPQEASVFRKLTVEENIRAVLELQQLPEEEIESRLTGLLRDLNIAHLRQSTALSLSGGERRRVEIARALATRPNFILLDEPFAGVDPIAVLDIQKIIRFLKQRGIGILITDHNVRETLGICDRAYIINEGLVLAFGKPDEIVYNENVRRVYLGENFRL